MRAMEDPALELVLWDTVELGDLTPGLLRQGELPGLWEGDETPVAALIEKAAATGSAK